MTRVLVLWGSVGASHRVPRPPGADTGYTPQSLGSCGTWYRRATGPPQPGRPAVTFVRLVARAGLPGPWTMPPKKDEECHKKILADRCRTFPEGAVRTDVPQPGLPTTWEVGIQWSRTTMTHFLRQSAEKGKVLPRSPVLPGDPLQSRTLPAAGAVFYTLPGQRPASRVRLS
jgi:hypothetical protein